MTRALSFAPFAPEAALDVLLRMRPADYREVFAARGDDCPYQLFAEIMQARLAALHLEIVRRGDPTLGEPLALYGVFHRSPGYGSALMIATPAFTPRDAAATARRVRAVVIPGLIRLGVRRVDCDSYEEHRAAHRFLARCGAAPGGAKPLAGKHGETFREFVWLAPWFTREEAA